VNVVGNCIATIVVAKWDNALKTETLYAQIGTGSLRAIPTARPAE
jgi:Na+/H+-dicarboxylate symporter